MAKDAKNFIFISINIFDGTELNSGLCTCKAGALLLEPHLQSIFLWLFWRWGSHELFAQAGLEP
jgi:hypothetical protein